MCAKYSGSSKIIKESNFDNICAFLFENSPKIYGSS